MKYINKDTGELLTRAEMLAQWRNEYDGDDPTNGLHWSEQYDPYDDPDELADGIRAALGDDLFITEILKALNTEKKREILEYIAKNYDL